MRTVYSLAVCLLALWLICNNSHAAEEVQEQTTLERAVEAQMTLHSIEKHYNSIRSHIDIPPAVSVENTKLLEEISLLRDQMLALQIAMMRNDAVLDEKESKILALREQIENDSRDSLLMQEELFYTAINTLCDPQSEGLSKDLREYFWQIVIDNYASVGARFGYRVEPLQRLLNKTGEDLSVLALDEQHTLASIVKDAFDGNDETPKGRL